MKKIVSAVVLLALVGCAHMDSETRTPIFNGTNGPAFSFTHMSATSFFDSSDNLTKAANHTAGTNGAGTYVSGLNETSSTSNLVNLLNAAAAIAAKAP